MTTYPHPTGYSPNAGARDFEMKAGDKFAIKSFGEEIQELINKHALLLKDVESPELEEAFMALEHHAAALQVAGDVDN